MTDAVTKRDIERAQRVVEAYAEGLDGLTMEECRDVPISSGQCAVLTKVLGKGEKGEVTEDERERLENIGFSKTFIDAIAGDHGKKALEERAKWLGSHALTHWYRPSAAQTERQAMVNELGQMSSQTQVATDFSLKALLEEKDLDVPIPDIITLEKLRQRINRETDNTQGDRAVLEAALKITTAPPEKIGTEKLIQAMKSWGQVEKLNDICPPDLVKDIQGRYLLFARHAAFRLQEHTAKEPEANTAPKPYAPVNPALQNLERQALLGSLPGFTTELFFLEGQHIATLIIGDPKKGAKAALRMRVGEGIASTTVEKEFGDRLQFQAPTTMVAGRNKGIEMMADEGKIVNWVFDPTRLDGYLVIYPDGSLHIMDKRRIRLDELTRNPDDAETMLDLGNPFDFRKFLSEVEQNKLSIVGSIFFEKKAGEEYTKAKSPKDSRRYILELDDGRFGMLDTEVDLSINDSLAIAWQIPGVVRVFYCDTGYYEHARRYVYDDKGRQGVELGIQDKDKNASRIVFYQGGR